MERYQGRVRVRACALVVRDHALLLTRLQSPARSDPIWIPPGGEVKAGETLARGAIREVYEETGLEVEPVRMSLVHEFIEPPYHAIEFYFVCVPTGGTLQLGTDPEQNDDNQILMDLKYISFEELADVKVQPEILRKHAHLLTQPSGEVQTVITFDQ